VSGARVVVEHVVRAYDGTRVIDDVSFVIEGGELVALTGPSGSGKTTLLQLIGSLDVPTSGSITVDGEAVQRLRNPAGYRRNTVGFVFQLHYLLPDLTARQNVELPLLASRMPRQERNARALEVLTEVGLGARADARPSDLSGGERQRVAIARALSGRPKLILADEPTGSLDSVASMKILELLADMRARHGTTVIIASHDPTLVERADRAIRVVDGKIVTPGEPVPTPEHIAAGRLTRAPDLASPDGERGPA
jgi:putative ABC transport system ATP-binding protein